MHCSESVDFAAIYILQAFSYITSWNQHCRMRAVIVTTPIRRTTRHEPETARLAAGARYNVSSAAALKDSPWGLSVGFRFPI